MWCWPSRLRLTPGGAPTLGYADLRKYFAGRLDTPTLTEVREAVCTIRARKAMVLAPDDPDSRSAGSFFKNPVVDANTLQRIETAARAGGLLEPNKSVPCYSQPDGRFKVAAAWLIERTGFTKGYQRGPVAISSKHTLALTNRGGATAGDVLSLMREIQAAVREQSAWTCTLNRCSSALTKRPAECKYVGGAAGAAFVHLKPQGGRKDACLGAGRDGVFRLRDSCVVYAVVGPEVRCS
jgi:hypothetical protein